MTDIAVRASATASVPRDYTIPGAQELLPKSVSASMDGSAAGAAWYPCLQVLDPGGNVMFSAIGTIQLAAGASADVSWFPHIAETPTGTSPVTAGTWTRVAEPLISPTVAWEGVGVQEPDVHYEAGTWKMWYSSSESATAVGYASCTGDPTIPANWTKYAGNPVLGQGGSGIAGVACRQHVEKISGTYHMWYSDSIAGGNVKRSTSADGITWNAPTTAISSGAVGGVLGWANSDVWFDGTYWWMFLEAQIGTGATNHWAPYLFKNTSPTNDGGWTVQNGGAALTSLQVSGYDYGYGEGPSIANINGTSTLQIGAAYILWWHASKSGSPVTSDIGHATGIAPSFVPWTPASPFDLAHNGTTYEQSQAADPNVLEVAGTSYLFFTGQNANTLTSYINLATFNGTLVQFLNGTQGGGTVANFTSTGGSISLTNPTGPTVNVDVAPSGVTAGTYGAGAQSGVVTVGTDGRVTSASVTPITVVPLTNPAVPDLIFTAAGDVIMGPS